MDKGGTDVWEAFALPARFFKNVGDSWLYGSQGEGPFRPGSDALYFEEPTPLVVNVLREVKTGWSAETMFDIWGPIFPLEVFVMLIFITSMFYCSIRIFQIRRVEKVTSRAAARPVASKDTTRIQLRWQGILEKVTSDDSQQWRVAILEADHMLSELLDVLGYKGETMTDKMRQIEVAAFNTIDFAWEAHQIRNRLTQDSSFELDAREAKRVIKMYERVFREFKFIPSE